MAGALHRGQAKKPDAAIPDYGGRTKGTGAEDANVKVWTGGAEINKTPLKSSRHAPHQQTEVKRLAVFPFKNLRIARGETCDYDMNYPSSRISLD